MKKIYLPGLVFILFFTICNVCNAQTCTTYTDCRPLPKMFVEKKIGNSRIRKFHNRSLFHRSKYKMLARDNGKQDKSIFLMKEAMDNLIIDNFEKMSGYKGIRVYFARYNECQGMGGLPGTSPNKVILLFSPVVGTSGNKSYYYLNANDPKIYPVDKVCADAWTKDYDTYDMPSLRKTIRKGDPDNYDKNNNNEFSDTKFVFYNKDSIHDAFVCEPQYQHNRGIEITGYEVSFSAYSRKGKNPNPVDTNTYKKRMFIQFNYMNEVNGKKEVFYLDKQSEYQCRQDKTIKIYQERDNSFKAEGSDGKEHSKGLDNGQLCPTYCQ